MARCMWHFVWSKPISVCIQIMYVYVSLLVYIYHMSKQRLCIQMYKSKYIFLRVCGTRKLSGDHRENTMAPCCWLFLWFPSPSMKHTVDGFRNPAVTSRFTGFQKHPRWWAGFLNHQAYGTILRPTGLIFNQPSLFRLWINQLLLHQTQGSPT